MEKQNRFFEFEVRAENNEEHGDFLTGRPIVFEAQTDMGGYYAEVIDRGALDHTDLKDVRFLVGHNTSMIPLARSRRNNANSTMQMEIDENGMAIRVDLDTENNAEARALYSATNRGDISGMSFMFTVDGEEWEGLESDYPTRHIRSIGRVFEVSAVAFPAYEQTSLEARSAEVLENAKATLEREKAEKRDMDVRERIKKLISGGLTDGNQ
jgi:HK97 family phage prohead protease